MPASVSDVTSQLLNSRTYQTRAFTQMRRCAVHANSISLDAVISVAGSMGAGQVSLTSTDDGGGLGNVWIGPDEPAIGPAVLSVVRIGSWVRVRDGELEEAWRVVDPTEADAARRLISVDTPLARALLGHRAGDVVRVQSPERRPVTILQVGW